MAGLTLAQAEARLQQYLAAEEAVLTGQSYTIAGRSLTRADLADIQKGIEIWNARAVTLDAGLSALGRGRSVTMIAKG